MFGTFRFLLASIVVLSHSGLYFKIPGFEWFNQGVSAVVGFYILSGYLMKHIFINKYKNSIRKTHFFYLDRIIRIYPQYVFYAVLTLLFFLITNASLLNIQLWPVLANIFVIPLNFFKLLDISFLKEYGDYAILIPPSWSLGTELQFYLIAPFLYRFAKFNMLAMIASLGIFVLASFSILDTELYEYRLLPGALILFLVGSLIYDLNYIPHKKSQNRIILLCIWLSSIILLYILYLNQKILVLYNGPVILGFIVSLPIIYYLSKLKFRPKIDDLLGYLSYGIYLNHYLIVWAFEKWSLFINASGIQLYVKSLTILIFSLILGYISYLITDKPIRLLRLKLRTSKIK